MLPSCASTIFTWYVDFLKVVRLVFWSGARSLALRARTIALRAHSRRATRSKARLVSKSTWYVVKQHTNNITTMELAKDLC